MIRAGEAGLGGAYVDDGVPAILIEALDVYQRTYASERADLLASASERAKKVAQR